MGDKVKELGEKWAREPLTNTDTAMSTAPTRSRHYCQKIKDSWQTLHKDKTNRILSVNEEQLHQLEKIKIENNCKKLNNLLNSVAYKGLDEVTEKLEDWYTNAQVAIVQSDCLFKELKVFETECGKIQYHLNVMKDVENRLWSELIATSSSSSTTTSSSSISKPQATTAYEGARGGETTVINCSASSAKIVAGGLNKQNNTQIQQPQQQQQQQQLQQQQQQQPQQQQQMLTDVTSLFLSCTDAATLNSLPGHLAAEISRLREAHSKMWSALEENQAIISEFESLCVEGNHSS